MAGNIVGVGKTIVGGIDGDRFVGDATVTTDVGGIAVGGDAAVGTVPQAVTKKAARMSKMSGIVCLSAFPLEFSIHFIANSL